MDSIQYEQFNSSEPENPQPRAPVLSSVLPNPQNRRIYIIIGVLALFMLLLTLTVGIKFSQVNQQMSDILISMQVMESSVKLNQKGDRLYPSSTMTSQLRDPCQQDWLFYKDKCYLISVQQTNWHDAEQNCIQQNAHLLVVNNREELVFLSRIAEPMLRYWIGLVERDVEGNWSWVDGTDFKSTEHFWDKGQPDDWDVRVNGEDCGQLHSISPYWHQPIKLWNDADCTLNYKYICERTA